jgi:hypothetical protein
MSSMEAIQRAAPPTI